MVTKVKAARPLPISEGLLLTEAMECQTDRSLQTAPLDEEPAFAFWQQDIPAEYWALDAGQLVERRGVQRRPLGLIDKRPVDVARLGPALHLDPALADAVALAVIAVPVGPDPEADVPVLLEQHGVLDLLLGGPVRAGLFVDPFQTRRSQGEGG